jgi:hypothetical protein
MMTMKAASSKSANNIREKQRRARNITAEEPKADDGSNTDGEMMRWISNVKVKKED